jgi:alkylation response protein AidB-like acyl-CoA dehydrogenase
VNLTLSEEQRVWQAKAREFARGVLAPASLARDRIPGGHEPFDWEIVRQGSKLGFRTAVVSKEPLAHATWSAHEAASFAYKAAGTAALRAGTIQHLFRDMHAGTQHITSSPPVYASIGRELGGLAKGKKWLFLNLVDQ